MADVKKPGSPRSTGPAMTKKQPEGETVSTHDAPQQNLVGRPSLYTPELAADICAALATGSSLRRICRAENMPHEATVRSWALSDDAFGKLYRDARDLGLDAMADETLDISDDSRNDTQIGEDGKLVTNFDHINRSRLRVDTRKWYLAKLAPKRYGDSARVEHTGADGKDLPAGLGVEALDLVKAIGLALRVAAERMAGDGAKTINHDATAENLPAGERGVIPPKAGK